MVPEVFNLETGAWKQRLVRHSNLEIELNSNLVDQDNNRQWPNMAY